MSRADKREALRQRHVNGSRCSGHCCERFHLPYSPDELWRMFDEAFTIGRPDTRRLIRPPREQSEYLTVLGRGDTLSDILMVAPMVRYLQCVYNNGNVDPTLNGFIRKEVIS